VNDGYTEIRNYLSRELRERQARNPAYSLRRFARQIAISPAGLSEFLSGKRGLSKAKAEKVLDFLGESIEEREALLKRLPSSRNHQLADSSSYTLTAPDHYKVICDWHHFAVLSLVKTKNFRPSTDWIASTLGIPKSQTKKAVDRLFSLGLLKETKNKKWMRTHKTLSTTDQIKNLAVRHSHYQDLELARQSLNRDAIEERDFTAMTMAINPEKIPEAKQRIRKFSQKLSHVLEADPKLEVYRLTVHLFPLRGEAYKEKKNENSI
jgi:uncharacterized protein (TIGR02147 family)